MIKVMSDPWMVQTAPRQKACRVQLQPHNQGRDIEKDFSMIES